MARNYFSGIFILIIGEKCHSIYSQNRFYGMMSSDRQPGSVGVKFCTKFEKCTKINPWKNLVFN